MKRKSLLLGGVFLTIFYSLTLVLSLLLTALCVVFFFVSDTIQIVNDLLLPIIDPFIHLDTIIIIAIMAALVIVSIVMIIGSSRFIKHAYSPVQTFSKKKKILIIFFILNIVMFAGVVYLLVTNIMSQPITDDIIKNGVLIGFTLIQVISIICCLTGLFKYKATLSYNEKEQTQTLAEAEVEQTESPAIYTDGLDPDEKQKPVVQQPVEAEQKPQEQQTPPPTAEKPSTKKLIEGITKLDQMRKEGSISVQEYTKLRSEMIKKFVK